MDPEEPPVEDDDVAAGHTWRHVRTAVTLLVLVVFVIGAAWYSWNQVTSDDNGDTEARDEATCMPVAPTDAPPREEIEVNVYNATQRGGLASDVAGKLRDRGFTIMDVANDPQESTVEGSAEVRTHPDQQAAAGLIAAMVPDAVVVPDDRSSSTIDLVLGEQFDELADEPDPDQTQDPCE